MPCLFPERHNEAQWRRKTGDQNAVRFARALVYFTIIKKALTFAQPETSDWLNRNVVWFCAAIDFSLPRPLPLTHLLTPSRYSHVY